MTTIRIRGKEYTPVSERILEFHRLYKAGEIHTEVLSLLDADTVWIRATVYPRDGSDRHFHGHSQASWDDKFSAVNKTAALENAETSAIGRALGFLGIGVIEGIASADEMTKSAAGPSGESDAVTLAPCTEPQLMPVRGLTTDELAITRTNPIDSAALIKYQKASSILEALHRYGWVTQHIVNFLKKHSAGKAATRLDLLRNPEQIPNVLAACEAAWDGLCAEIKQGKII